jgi:uncharacterized membrane protein
VPKVPSFFKFQLCEYLYRDTSPSGRKRFSRVSIHADRTENGMPFMRIYVNSVTDYQLAHHKDGRGYAYASLGGEDPNGWSYKEGDYARMLERVDEWHRPTRVLVERLTARARNLMLAYCKERV